MNIKKTRENLIKRLRSVHFESEDDEGAAEYCAEIESVISCIDAGFTTPEQIRHVAKNVGLEGDLV
jgi:hypothetical protein